MDDGAEALSTTMGDGAEALSTMINDGAEALSTTMDDGAEALSTWTTVRMHRRDGDAVRIGELCFGALLVATVADSAVAAELSAWSGLLQHSSKGVPGSPRRDPQSPLSSSSRLALVVLLFWPLLRAR